MKTFKFLAKPISTNLNHQYGSVGMSVAVFDGGKTITSLEQPHQHASDYNKLWFGNSDTNPIWWYSRYEEYLHHRSILKTYEGTIGRFIHTYRYRRAFNEFIIPYNPVLVEIQYGTSRYYNNDIKFSHEDMWVRITYKVFYEAI